MKQFKFLAMAIFAMIMSIGFVACSSDDDDNNGGGSITSGKKLVRISSKYETINFTYGEDGKLTRASRNVNGNSEYINLVTLSRLQLMLDGMRTLVLLLLIMEKSQKLLMVKRHIRLPIRETIFLKLLATISTNIHGRMVIS